MTTCLSNIVLTAGAERMAALDPHGVTLTIISVSVVFIALIILYGLYSLSGRVFSGELKADAKRAKRVGKRLAKMAIGHEDPQEDVAAAIALALDMEQGGDTYAAIATALHMYFSDTVHDTEPGIVTITRKDSPWNNKSLTFRKMPK